MIQKRRQGYAFYIYLKHFSSVIMLKYAFPHLPLPHIYHIIYGDFKLPRHIYHLIYKMNPVLSMMLRISPTIPDMLYYAITNAHVCFCISHMHLTSRYALAKYDACVYINARAQITCTCFTFIHVMYFYAVPTGMVKGYFTILNMFPN